MAELNHIYKDVFLFMSAVENNNQSVIEMSRPKMIEYATRRPGNNVKMISYLALSGKEEIFSRVREVFIKGGVLDENGEVIAE